MKAGLKRRVAHEAIGTHDAVADAATDDAAFIAEPESISEQGIDLLCVRASHSRKRPVAQIASEELWTKCTAVARVRMPDGGRRMPETADSSEPTPVAAASARREHTNLLREEVGPALRRRLGNMFLGGPGAPRRWR